MKNRWIIILGCFLILVVCLEFVFVNLMTSSNSLELKKDLIMLQNDNEVNLVSDGYTIYNPNVVLNPYGNSPLTALVMFETTDEVAPVVTIKGKDRLSTYTHTFEKGKDHYLPIYGLYANYNNEVVISFGDISKSIFIKTEPLPDDFVLPIDIYKNVEFINNDLYFFTPSSQGYTCAYDVNGEVRWYLTNYALWKIDRLENGHLLVSTDRLINSPYYMTGLYEMDLLGKIYAEYNVSGGYHHDYFEMENGNILLASDDFNNDDGTVEDYIIEIDRKTGRVVKSFDLKDILNMEDGKSENWTAYDWFHNNSVWYDKNTNSITLSGRHQDAVINIDYSTKKLNWIVGDPTGWSEEYQKYFFKPLGDDFEWQWSQHAAMITPEGYVFVLDNGNNKSKIKEKYVPASKSYTRGVMYKIDTDNMTISQIWEYGKERGSEYYSPYISDVDYIDNNHYMVHSGGISFKNGEVLNVPALLGGADEQRSITTEIKNDKVVFEIVLPTNNYRVEKMGLYSNDIYKKEKAQSFGSLGKTKVDDKKIWLYKNVEEVNNLFEEYDISLVKEKDRLVFKGRFTKDKDVNLILYSNMVAKYYDVPISKKPYTALCVDIFTEEETQNGIMVTKYINNVGLYDKYSIYIEIDDVVYDVDKYIEFY